MRNLLSNLSKIWITNYKQIKLQTNQITKKSNYKKIKLQKNQITNQITKKSKYI